MIILTWLSSWWSMEPILIGRTMRAGRPCMRLPPAGESRMFLSLSSTQSYCVSLDRQLCKHSSLSGRE